MKLLFTWFLMIGLSLLHSHVHASSLMFSAESDRVDRNEFCYLKVNIPVLTAKDSASTELYRFVESANAGWAQRLESFKRAFNATVNRKNMCKDLVNANQVTYSFTIMTELDAKIASLLFTHYVFTGGAHGRSGLEAETFNSVTGQRYTSLTSFFDEQNLENLKAAIFRTLKRHYSIDPEFGFNKWAKETASLSQITNFYFTPNGMKIFFQEYEVGPYADGNISAFFDWDELKVLGFRPPAL